MKRQNTFNDYFDSQLWFIGWDIRFIYDDFISFGFTKIPKQGFGTSRYVHTFNKYRYDLWGWGVCVLDYSKTEAFFFKRFEKSYKIKNLDIFTKMINQPDEIETSNFELQDCVKVYDLFIRYENYINEIYGNDFRKEISEKEKIHQNTCNLLDFWKDINEKSIHIN